MKLRENFKGLKSFIILWLGQSLSTLGSGMSDYALLIWAYQQQGTASSITWLAVCSYLPSILFCFAAGTLADRWDKKRIMLVSDLIAALGTLTVLVLYSSGELRIWQLYIVNAVISMMNAFQHPASYVAVSLLAPKEQYTRANGLQSFSSSLTTIITPAIATAVLAFAGLEAVLAIDLLTFAVAFTSLALLIKIPRLKSSAEPNPEKAQSVIANSLSGLRFLKEHAALLRLILFFSVINLLAALASSSILPAMILVRTGKSEWALGMVNTAIGVGTLLGSVIVTLTRPPRDRLKWALLGCGMSFLIGDIGWAIGRSVLSWVIAAFLSNLPLPFLNANLTATMREHVPLEMQGRVFATRDTLQYITIPLGYALAGPLADNVFEPFMRTEGALQSVLRVLMGEGAGSGMGIIFIITGLTGFVISVIAAYDKRYSELN